MKMSFRERSIGHEMHNWIGNKFVLKQTKTKSENPKKEKRICIALALARATTLFFVHTREP